MVSDNKITLDAIPPEGTRDSANYESQNTHLVVKLKQLPGTGTGSAHAELVLMAEGIFKHP